MRDIIIELFRKAICYKKERNIYDAFLITRIYMQFTNFKNLMVEKFKSIIGYELNDIQIEKFFDYMNLLIETNKVMNLTAIDEPKEIVVRHFVDSSILIKLYGQYVFDNKKIIDIGTGAGFPGLPLAIVSGKGKFVLTDTLGKRVKFLENVIESIGLKNVELVKDRAEVLGHNKRFREQFDYSVSRGVAKFSVLSEYSLPFIKVKGKMLSYKMNDCDIELFEGKRAIEKLGGKFRSKKPYKLFDNEPERAILEIEKVEPTSKSYPRKVGTPSKQPLS